MTIVLSIAIIVGVCQGLKSINNHSMGNYCEYPNLISYLFFYNINENDSNDNTKKILEQASKKYNLHYLSEDLNTRQYGSVKVKERINLLSDYRNKCIEKIKELINNNTITNPDYIIVVDLDFKEFFNEGIIHSIGWMKENPSTKACAGNSFEPKTFGGHPITWNYDSWAFRLNWWEDIQKYNNPNTHQDLMYWFGLWVPPVGCDPIKVNSAFGGSCIYKSEYYLKGHYDSYDCEHVCFHKYLHDNFEDFELRLNPSQIMLLS
jgi:hypothetical protein